VSTDAPSAQQPGPLVGGGLMTATAILVNSSPGLDITYPPLPSVLGILPHGILAAIGIAVGAWLLIRRLRAENLPVETAESALMWGIPAGIIGARLDYVISHPGQFSSLYRPSPCGTVGWPCSAA
jgi:hypothetical protein